MSYTWEFTSQPDGSDASLSGANTATPTFTPSTAGDYTAQLTVTDGNGGSDTDSVTITGSVRGTAPEQPRPGCAVIDSFTATPNPASVDDEVTLTWEITGEVTTLTVTDLETNQTRNVTDEDNNDTEVTAVSTRDFRLTATNSAGEVSEDLTLTVGSNNSNQAPDADFSSEQQEGTLQVQFNASSSSDADGQIVSYSWDFGDGDGEITPQTPVLRKRTMKMVITKLR